MTGNPGHPPTVGLAIIAKDEETTLPNLLASIQGAFDEVILVDTGSKDETVAVFERWADEELAAGRLRRAGAAPFTWVHDFAAARNFADSLLNTDWKAWADCDDVIRGAENFRQLAADAPPELAGYIAGYLYGRDPHGNTACYLHRERLVRAGASEWKGRVHEAQHLQGPVTFVGPDVLEYVHAKHEAGDPERNRKILRRWLKDEPENARVLSYLGTEELARGRHKKAVSYFRRYLKLANGWTEERAQVYRKLCTALQQLGKNEEATDLAFEAMRLMPSWPDSYLTLAETHFRMGDLERAAEWAREVLRRGAPETLLIVNPLDYSVQPRVVLAGALAALGDLNGAIGVAEEAVAIVPDEHRLVGPLALWRSTVKREETARRWVESAEILAAHDEQLKALAVLETVPHFAQDHPQVVAARSGLRERLAPLTGQGYDDHYENGGSKPEDFAATADDDHALAIAGSLPRSHMLLQGLEEQSA